MNIDQLAESAGLTVHGTVRFAPADITHFFAGDKISDLLNHASPTTLIVTHLRGSSLMQAAELMDAPAICLVDNAMPSPELVAAAAERDVAVLVSPVGLEDTDARIRRILFGPKKRDA